MAHYCTLKSLLMSYFYHPRKRKNIAEIWSSESCSVLMFTFLCCTAFKKCCVALKNKEKQSKSASVTFLFSAWRTSENCFCGDWSPLLSLKWMNNTGTERGRKRYLLLCTVSPLFLQDCELKPAALERQDTDLDIEIHDSHSLTPTQLVLFVVWKSLEALKAKSGKCVGIWVEFGLYFVNDFKMVVDGNTTLEHLVI